MPSQPPAAAQYRLEELSPHDDIKFITPVKRINDGDDLTFFLSSTAYRDLMTWLFQLDRSMFPTKLGGGKIEECKLSSPPAYSNTIENLRMLLEKLAGFIQQAPPSTGPRRFGNVAFRAWHKLVDSGANELLETYLDGIFSKYGRHIAETKESLRNELKVYLLGSFGSAQRLDYGTGHELSFLAFLACLWKLGAFQRGEERAVVIGVVQPYLELVRKLVLSYTLEPAGSHGVWGLDDHSFVPYIFGSAQLSPAIDPDDPTKPIPTEGSMVDAPMPSCVTDKTMVGDYKDVNMYFSAIQFIYDVKKGPFWEHSPVLFDVSGIKDGWGKINKGMLKMYAAEVLGKFPVVQHFPFGRLFAWERDPEAIKPGSSVHSQQQPRSMDVPPAPAPASGTKAPWANTAGDLSRSSNAMNKSMEGMRAPWAASASIARPRSSIPGPGMPPMASPRSMATRAPPVHPRGAARTPNLTRPRGTEDDPRSR